MVRGMVERAGSRNRGVFGVFGVSQHILTRAKKTSASRNKAHNYRLHDERNGHDRNRQSLASD